MSDHPTYRIEHIADLLLIPADKRADALRELGMAIAAAGFVFHLADARDPRRFLPYILWTDDGMREATADLGGGHALVVSAEKQP